MFEVSVNTIRRWRAANKLPAPVLVSGRVRWRRSDIIAYMADL
jgi:predicted DNA-binding transcriptional regulator AlpA